MSEIFVQEIASPVHNPVPVGVPLLLFNKAFRTDLGRGSAIGLSIAGFGSWDTKDALGSPTLSRDQSALTPVSIP
jgi:hypothetical protein